LTRLGYEAGRPVFDYRRQQQRIFFFRHSHHAQTLSYTTVTGAPSAGSKRSGRDLDHSLPPHAEVKNAWSYTSTPPVRLHGMVLGQAHGQPYFYSTISPLQFCRESSVGIATGYGLEDRMIGVRFPAGAMMGIFFLDIMSRPPLGSTQSPTQWVSGTLSLGVERPGREADHSPPSRSEVKNAWSYTSILSIGLHGMVFNYAQGHLYLYLYLSISCDCSNIHV
jgi:hypothetical protein